MTNICYRTIRKIKPVQQEGADKSRDSIKSMQPKENTGDGPSSWSYFLKIYPK
jgi:hypothetical protein